MEMAEYMDAGINEHTEAIINTQLNEYKKYNNTDIEQLSDEDVILKNELGCLRIIKNNNANPDILNRLDKILPLMKI